MTSDSDFMYYRSCKCSGQNQYWGPDSSSGTLTVDARAAEKWRCRSCLSLPHVHCDSSAVPLHCVHGDVYPYSPSLFHSSRATETSVPSGPFACVQAALQQVVLAQPIACRAQGVCNVGEDVCVRQQTQWYNERVQRLRSRATNGSHAAPQVPSRCGPLHHPDGMDARWQLFPGYWCAEGHDPHSLLCSQCVPDYYQLNGRCLPCRAAYQWLVPLAFALVLLGVLAYVTLKVSIHNQPGSSSVPLSYGVQWVQLASVVASSSGSPAAGGATFHGALGELLSFRPLAFECTFRSWSWLSASWLLLVSPMAVGVLVSVVVGGWHLCRSQPGTVLHVQAALITICNWLYVPVLQRVLQVLHCDSVGGTTAASMQLSFVSSAPFVDCHSTAFQRLMAFAVVCLLAFCVVFPSLAVWRLHHLRHDSPGGWGCFGLFQLLGRASPAWRVLANVLQPERRWWLAVRFAITIGIVCCTALLPFQSAWISVSLFGLLLLQLLLHMKYQPYARLKDNWLVTGLLVILLLLYLQGILQSAGQNSGRFQEGSDTVATLLYSAAVALVLLNLLVPQLKGVSYAGLGCWLQKLDAANHEEEQADDLIEPSAGSMSLHPAAGGQRVSLNEPLI